MLERRPRLNARLLRAFLLQIVLISATAVAGVYLAEFAIREDNIDREVVSARPATQPLYIELLGDTTKSAAGGMMVTPALTFGRLLGQSLGAART